ncbi:copper chaperone PCu(A)C [Caenispirillum bisanense]|uniref:Copper(I)-binding protein n=1 Tax=Caenispirillum bisanense TaxID=414052 RepID=A0A286H045_9PROT|nr:copper chaperone PCu(A)C [Caenispirillum bisanense]SOE00719.1 hypothetical protein SAMN05421508_1143 [Caenispirillum bisanense]
MPRTPAILTAAALFAAPAFAVEEKVTTQHPPRTVGGTITISDTWVEKEVGPQRMASAYAVIENTGDSADTLLGATTDAAGEVEMHTYLNRGPVRQMQRIARIPIGPGETARLAPGDRHLMLVDLQHPLDEENTIDLTLRFEVAGEVTVNFDVRETHAGQPLSAEVPEEADSRERTD